MIVQRVPLHQFHPLLIGQLPQDPPIPFRSEPKIDRLRYFGTNTTWYLQYHRTWERLCHSLMTVSFLVNLTVHVRETVAVFTPERQSLLESRRQRRRLTN